MMDSNVHLVVTAKFFQVIFVLVDCGFVNVNFCWVWVCLSIAYSSEFMQMSKFKLYGSICIQYLHIN